jgi:polyisoprenoid-binding protein YceI
MLQQTFCNGHLGELSMATTARDTQSVLLAPGGRWRTIDHRGTVAFKVMTLWGLATVTGAFQRYRGTLTAGSDEIAAELTIDAASVTTRSARRDRALRSAGSNSTFALARTGRSR